MDTNILRNPGYEHHLFDVIEKVFSGVDKELAEIAGFTITEAIRMSRAIVSKMNERIESLNAEGRRDTGRFKKYAHRNRTVDEWVEFGLPKEFGEVIVRLPNRDRTRAIGGYVAWRFANKLHTAMTIDAKSLAIASGIGVVKANRFLNGFSLDFGQAAIGDNWPSHVEIQKAAPLVRLGECSYLTNLARTVQWSLRPNLEHQLKNAQSGRYWSKYERRRADAMEKEASSLIEGMLANCKSFKNLRYQMPNNAGDPTEYELDGLFIYDDALIVLEVKSGTISPAGRRGAPSLGEDLEPLLLEGHQQASRASKYIFETDRPSFVQVGGDRVELDSTSVRQVVEVVVTLDSVAAFAPLQLGHLGLANLPVPVIRWSIEILDLKVIADLIEFGPQLIHYLNRLNNADPDTLDYLDPLDAFGKYLLDGLPLAKEVDDRFDGKLRLFSHTTEMDEYYAYKLGERLTVAKNQRWR